MARVIFVASNMSKYRSEISSSRGTTARVERSLLLPLSRPCAYPLPARRLKLHRRGSPHDDDDGSLDERARNTV